MKIPNKKQIDKGDFEEKDQPLVEQLGIILDYNFEKVFTALNKNVSLVDNTAGFVKDIEITVDSSGIPVTPARIQSSLVPARPIGCLVVDHTNLTNSTIYPTSGIMISYSESSGLVTIEHITGLPANNKFKLKVVFFS